MQNLHTSNSKYLLALHSSSESFGIAVKDVENPESKIKSEVFNIGRSLSNKLFICTETILPKRFWNQIIRISVAKGPGGFTSTRLTISMARILSQQINCPLDSISSFHLMAPRLYQDIHKSQISNPFWIKEILPRRGVVAGKYKFVKINKETNFHEFKELITPQIIKSEKDINPSIKSSYNIEKDIISLINFSQNCQSKDIKSFWGDALPIYPTSPIDNKNR